MAVTANPAPAEQGQQTSGTELERPWILLEVTRRCNFQCLYCYATQGGYDEELSVGQLERILERVTADVIPRGITLIGGEPLLVEWLGELIRCIHERGIVTSLSTKGASLDEAAIVRLTRAGLNSVELSLDALDPAIYAQLTGSAMPRVQEVITTLVRRGVFVTVGTMLTRPSLPRLEVLLELCFALGVRRVSLNQMAQVGSGLVHCDLGLCTDELVTALERANACATALGLSVAVGLPVEPCRISHERYPSLLFEACGCGDRKWLIEPSGSVRTCELAPSPIGNVLQSPWRDIVASEASERFRTQKRNGHCGECEHWLACRGGCRYRSKGAGAAQSPAE